MVVLTASLAIVLTVLIQGSMIHGIVTVPSSAEQSK